MSPASLMSLIRPLSPALSSAMTLGLMALGLMTIGLSAQLEAVPLSYQQRVHQAELYVESKLYEQAVKELKELERSPEGSQDVRVSELLSLAYYHSNDINKALYYLRKARQLTEDEGFKARLTQNYQQWIKVFGLVQFASINEVPSGAIELNSDRKILNPKRRAAFKVAQRQLRRGVTLPLSMYLPFGSYVANSVPFQIKPSYPSANVELSLIPVKDEAVSTKTSKWVYITLGGVALIATALGGYYLLSPKQVSGTTVMPTFN